MQVWTVNRRVPFEALPVCSDETVGRSEEDAAVAHTSELGVPVTTDPHDIAAFLRRRSGPHVVFSTYQSSPQIAAAFALGRVPAFDFVVADEAHPPVVDQTPGEIRAEQQVRGQHSTCTPICSNPTWTPLPRMWPRCGHSKSIRNDVRRRKRLYQCRCPHALGALGEIRTHFSGAGQVLKPALTCVLRSQKIT